MRGDFRGFSAAFQEDSEDLVLMALRKRFRRFKRFCFSSQKICGCCSGFRSLFRKVSGALQNVLREVIRTTKIHFGSPFSIQLQKGFKMFQTDDADTFLDTIKLFLCNVTIMDCTSMEVWAYRSPLKLDRLHRVLQP